MVHVREPFLQAQLPKMERILIKLPHLTVSGSASRQAVELVMSPYGLRHATGLCYAFLSKQVIRIGFRRLLASNCLFVCRIPDPVYIIAYSNDPLIWGTNQAITGVKAGSVQLLQLRTHWSANNSSTLRLNAKQDVIFLFQKAYTDQIIENTGMANDKGGKVRLILGHPLYGNREPLT